MNAGLVVSPGNSDNNKKVLKCRSRAGSGVRPHTGAAGARKGLALPPVVYSDPGDSVAGEAASSGVAGVGRPGSTPNRTGPPKFGLSKTSAAPQLADWLLDQAAFSVPSPSITDRAA
jgi:hypothetical protein